jgi:hypothetical protein
VNIEYDLPLTNDNDEDDDDDDDMICHVIVCFNKEHRTTFHIQESE